MDVVVINSYELSEWCSMSLRGMEALHYLPESDIGDEENGHPVANSTYFDHAQFQDIVVSYGTYRHVNYTDLQFGDFVVTNHWNRAHQNDTYPLMIPFTGVRESVSRNSRSMLNFVDSTYFCILMFVGMAPPFRTFMQLGTPSPMFLFMASSGALPNYEGSILRGTYIPIRFHIPRYMVLNRSQQRSLTIINRFHRRAMHNRIEWSDDDEE